MPSASTQATHDGKHLRTMRQRLVRLAIGLATAGALLPATASSVKFNGPAHSRARPTLASADARQLSDATIVEYGLPASEWL